jgi:hypothetical protein
MNTGFYECDLDELNAVSAGFFSNFAALNPQPIPPGRQLFSTLAHGSLVLPPNPGCPGPVQLPPSPC